MLQNKQSFSFLNFRRWLFLLIAVVVSLSFGVGLNAGRTHAQQQPNANSNTAQKTRSKRIAPLRTSETADGSRVTITSDGELNDYSAYRSGDRFIVVVPQAEGAGGGASGRGFEGAQVERRGKDLVYTFKLQPGATARVNQRFNRLDVQFSASKDAAKNTNTAVVKPTPAPTPAKRTLAEEAGLTKPPANANVQPTPDARRTPDANANSNSSSIAATTATPFAVPSPTAAIVPGVVATPTLAPVDTPQATGDQLAQAQQTNPAPAPITTNAPATASPSVGAVVLRNWPWLIAALLAVGIGLLFVSRFSGRDRDQSRSLPPAAPSSTKPLTVKETTKTPELKPANASTASALSKPSTSSANASASPLTSTATSSSTAATTEATAATATAAGLTAATGGNKPSKKQKKKAEKAKRLAEASERKKGSGGTATATTATGASTASKTTEDAGAAGAASTTAAITGAIIAGASGMASSSAKAEESKAVETKFVETKATETKAIEPESVVKAAETKRVEPSVAFDPERIEVEIKKLLAGESYDESYINATDEGTRQLVSAELMSAVAGRNEARKGHARTAFLKHGYFDEVTRSLQSAEAPGERAAAARTLGLVGDRSATVHLTAALEDPAADVRRTTVEALAELQDPAAVGALEALRWRETSRQVPRTLIQRAIEASKTAEEEAEEITPVEDDDDTPTLVTAPDSSPVALAVTEPPEKESKEIETGESGTKEIEVSAATKAIEVSVATPTAIEESEAEVQEASLLAPVVSATPQATVAFDESPTVETQASAVETEAAPEATKELEVVETKALDVAAPLVEPEPAEEETTPELETITAHNQTDLAAVLAAKEASLIKAREQQETELAESEEATKAVAPFEAAPVAESSAASLESAAQDFSEFTFETPSVETQPAPLISSLNAPATAEATGIEVSTATEAETASQPVYHSDFKVGSGQQFVPGEDEWIDLDADEHGVTVQSIEPFVAPPAALPAEPLGPFYAENATDVSPTGMKQTPAAPPASETIRREEPQSLLDSLKIETFETNHAEPAPIIAMPVELEHFDDATTQPLTFDLLSPADEQLRGTEVVKADKSLSLVDGSDEDDYSIIPKGIQVRLASDDSSERAASLLALSRLNTDEAFSEICAAFDDSQEEVRNAAARALYDLNEDRAESFTRALREAPVERRRQIGAALAGSGLADEAIGNLTGESRDKTYDAFSLLFLMAKAGEVAPLIRAIESHADNEVRLAVVKLLALSGQQEILPAFRRLAVRGSLPAEVRSAVMEAIYQISSQPQNATPTT